MKGTTATSYSFRTLIPDRRIGFIFLTSINALHPIASSVEGIPVGILSILRDELMPAGLGFLVRSTMKCRQAGLPVSLRWCVGTVVRFVFGEIIFQVAFVWFLLRQFETGLQPLLHLDPHIGWTNIGGVATAVLSRVLQHMTKAAANP